MQKKLLAAISILLIFMSSLAFSAFSTSLTITSEVRFRALADIRVNGVSLDSANGGTLGYESDYSKNTVSNGFILPTSGASISYSVQVDNLGDLDYSIYDIFKTTSDNGLTVTISGYNLQDVIPAKTSVNVILTYTTSNPSENVINVVQTFDFKKVFYVRYETGTTQVIGAQTKYEGVDLALTSTVPTKTGYTFARWNTKSDGTGVNYNSGANYTIDDDVIMYARYTLDTYTITYNLNNGTNNQNNPATYTYETNDITLGDASKTGYTFNGWTGNGTTSPTKNLVLPKHSTGNKTFTANFTANTYTINYTMNGGNNPSTKPTSGTYDQDVVISNPTKTVTITPNVNNTGADIGNATSANQTFAGWSATVGSNAKTGTSNSDYSTWDGTATTNTYFKNLKETGTVTMVANWTPVAVTLPSLSKTGYTCKWYTDPTNGTELGLGGASYTPSANSNQAITAYARCTANTYTVTAKANGGTISSTSGWTGTGNTATKTVTYDQAYGTLPTISRPGYTFKGWNGKNLFETGVLSDYYIYSQSTMNVSISGNIITGTVLSGQMALVRNEKHTYYSGIYTFTQQSTGAKRHLIYPYDDNGNILTNSDITISGWTYNQYYHAWYNDSTTVTTVIPSVVSYWKYGMVFTGTAGQSKELSDIQIEEGSTTTPYEPYYLLTTTNVTRAGNHEINAIWERDTYTITYALNNGTASGTNPTEYNVETETFTLNNPTKTLTFVGHYNATSGANAASGQVTVGNNTTAQQTFKGWSGTDLTGETNQTVTISQGSTGNRSYEAHWTAVAPTSLPTVTRTGYTCGWSTSSTGTTIEYDNSGNHNYPTSAITEGMEATVNLYAVCVPNTYTIGYTMNGGTQGTNAPTSGTYDTDVVISKPTKTFTVNIDGNSQGATVKSGNTVVTSASSTQTFAGWTGTNINISTAKYGAAANPSTAWNGTTKIGVSTDPLYLLNLRSESGTVTMIANWTPVAITLPIVEKTGYQCKYNTASNGSGTDYTSGGSYTPSATTNNAKLYVICSANTYNIAYVMNNGNDPNTKPVSGTYDANVIISNPTKTVTITGDVNGTGASVGSDTSSTQTFLGWSSTVGSNAQSGTSTSNYASWNGTATTNTYFKNLTNTNNATVTMTANWTPVAVTLPSLSKTGYICKWYSEATGGNELGLGGDSYTPTVNSNQSITVYARCSEREDTAYRVNHYVHDLGTNTYTLNSYDDLTGRTNATLTVANLKKTISGFTYVDGYLTGNTTKPTSGAVTTTTISADGSRVINLYYRRNYLYVQYHVNGGSLASTHGSGFGVVNGFVSYNSNINFLQGVYGSKVGSVNTTTYVIGANGLYNYNYSGGLNIEKAGYKAVSGSEWNTSAQGTGTSYGQDDGNINANGFAGADLSTGDAVVTVYVNWTPVNYTLTYALNNGTLASANPASYNIESNPITLNNPTKTLTFVGHYNATSGANASSTDGVTIGANTTQAQTFAGWSGTGLTGNNNNPVTIATGSTGNRNYTAHYTATAGTVPTVTRTGYTCGWNTSESGTTIEIASGGSYATSRITEGMGVTVNLYAVCTPNTYTVTAKANGGSIASTSGWTVTGNTATKSVTYDDVYGTLPSVFRTGYTFLGWNGKNLFISELENGSITNSTGANSSSNAAVRSIDYIPVESNTLYTISNDNNYANYVYEYDSDNQFIRHVNSGVYSNPYSFTTSVNAAYVRVRSIVSNNQNDLTTLYQLEEGSTATPYEPYYIADTTTVTRAGNHEINAKWSINNPATPTISGGTTKVYGSSATTLTCSTSTDYASGTTKYYSFGYASSDGGTPSNWTTASTSNQLNISATEYVGQRWYSCRVYASDGTLTTSTVTSAAASDTEMTINNAKLTFDINSCGTINNNGTSPAYVKNGTTGVLTTIRGTAAGTIPTLSKTGYTFNGWYDGTTKVINADGTIVASVSNWTDSSKNWLISADKTLKASCTAKTYTLTINPQGGTYSGSTSNATKQMTYDATTNNDIGAPTRSGYTFNGWYTSANGGTQIYDSNGQNTNASSYWTAAYSTGKWKYDGDVTVYAKWTKAVSSLTNTLSATDFVYSGSAQGPSVTVKDGNTTLTLNTDYTVSGNSNTNVGQYAVTITGANVYNTTTKAYYAGTTTLTYYINNAKITWDANSCGTISGTNPAYVKKGATGVYTTIRGTSAGTIPTVSLDGYTFNGWYDGSTKVINADGTIVASVSNWTDSSKNWLITADKTLKANCNATSYTVTANANGGTIASSTGWTGTGASATKSVTYDSTYGTLPTVTRTGYTFDGWYKVPYEFDELDYIVVNGSQYIDTGYIPNANTRIYAKFAHNEHSKDTPIFGTRKSDYSNSYTLWSHPTEYTSATVSQALFNSTNKSLNKYAQGTIIEFEYSKTSGHYGNQTWTWSPSSGSPELSLILFGLRNGTSMDNRKFSGYMYAFKIWDNNELVHDYIPVQRKSDSVQGMYDVVEKKFYTLSNTSTTHSEGILTSSSVVKTPENHTIKAGWSANTYTVTYNGNGNTGGSTASSAHFYDLTSTLTANGFTRSGYTFAGWNTQADGSGTNYTNSQSVTNLTSTDGATITLYAKWSKAATSLTKTLSATDFIYNGSTQGPSVTVKDGNTTLTAGTDYTISGNSNTNVGEYTITITGSNVYNSTTNAYYIGTTTLTYYINNAQLTFDKGSCTSTSGTTTLYTKKGATKVYTGIRNTTEGSIPTASKSGYTFQGWYTASSGGSKVLNANGGFTGTAVTNYTNASSWQTVANQTLYAQCTRDNYTISYSMNNGTNNANNPSSYNVESSAITLAAPTKTLIFKGNYNTTAEANAASGSGVTIGSNTQAAQTFAGWTGSNGTTAQTSVTIPAGSTGDKAYTAHWTAVAPATLPTVTKVGYTCGWSTSSSGTTIEYQSGATNYPTSLISEGQAATVNLYAVCTPKTYTLTINPQGGTYNSTTNNSTKTMTYDSSNNNDIGVPTRSGYTFDGWYIEANSKTNKLFDNTGKNTNLSGYFSAAYSTGVWKHDDDVTVYAHWSKAVTATTNSISPTSYIYDGTAKTPTPSVSDGATTLTSGIDYTIAYTNNTNVGTATATITGAGVYNATTKAYYTGTKSIDFEINNAKLTFNKGNCDSTSGTTTLYTKKGATGVYTGIQNTTAGTIPTASKTGYTFQGWYTASSNGSKVLNANGTFTGTAVSGYTNATSWQTVEDKTLYAVCAINSYTLTINPNGGTFNGTTSNTTVTQNYGTTYSVSNNPTKTGYIFTGWSKSGTGTYNYYDSSVTTNATTTLNYNSASSALPNIYNNKGNGSVTREMVADSTATGGYSLKITTNGEASPNAGGIVPSLLPTTPGRIAVIEIKAKIPSGYTLNAVSGNLYQGTGSNYRSDTRSGTGNWETYYLVYYYGDTGGFGSTTYLSLSGTNNTSVTWYVDYIKMWNYSRDEYKSKFTFGAGNGTLTANWAASGSKVSFKPNGGTFNTTYVKSWSNSYFGVNSTNADRFYRYDTAYGTHPGADAYDWTPDTRVISRAGYTFQGWYTEDGTQIFDADGKLNASLSGYSDANSKWIKYDENVTVYARWSKEVSSLTSSVSPASYIYDGTAKTPTPSVSDGATTLTSGTDYTITYTNNTNVGTATATITGKSAYNATTKAYYTGTTTVSYYINNATLTFNKGTCDDISGSTTLYTKKGATVVYTGLRETTTTGTIPTATKSGYTFQGWYTASTGGSKALNANGSFTGTAVSGYTNATSWQTVEDKTLYARCSMDDYSITYSMNNGTNNANNPDSYAVTSPAITIVGGEKILIFKGNYNATSGSNASSTDGVTIGSNTTKAQTFAGWSGTGLTGNNNNPVVIPTGSTGNRTYTAHWTAVAGNTPTVTRTGYTCGWSTSSTGTTIEIASGGSYATSRITEGMAATVNLYAVCTPKTYTLTINPQGGTYNSTTNNSTKTMTYDSSNNNDIGVPTRSGYTFDGWYIEANSKTNKLFDNTGKNTNLSGYFSAAYSTGVWQKDANVTVYAHWSKAVTATTNSISPTSYIYDGTAKTPTPSVSDGATTLTSGTDYTISYTNNTNVGTATATITGKSAYNATTKAYYTGTTTVSYYINNATLTFNKGTCDDISGSTTLYTKKGATGVYTGIQNTTAGTIPTASKTGYTFQGWYTASSNGTKVLNANGTFTGTAVANYTTASAWDVTADQTLYAVCTPTSYTVTANANGGTIASTTGWTGTGNTATKQVTYDEEYGTLPNVSRTGYTFGGWSYGTVFTGRTSSPWVEQLIDNSNLSSKLTAGKSYKVEYDITLNEAIPSGYEASQTSQWGRLGIRTGSSNYQYTFVSGGALYPVSGANYTVGTKYHISGTITTPSDLSTAVMVFYTARSTKTGTSTGYVINGTISGLVFYENTDTYGNIDSSTTVKVVSDHEIKANWSINSPATPTITGGETKVYGKQATTLTCSTSTTYASGTTLYYSFGYATSNGGTPSNWTSFTTGNTLSVAADAYVGQRWYSCRVYAIASGEQSTPTITSLASADAEVTINNAKITWDTNSCGTISGTSPAYVRKGATGVYTGVRNSTAGTVASVSKSGYTFNGWYDGTTKVINANGTIVASVSNWTDSSSKWLITADKTLKASCSRDTYLIDYALNNGTNSANNPSTYHVESNAITLQAPTKTLTFKGNPNATEGANAASGEVTIGANTTADQEFAGWSGTGLTGNNNNPVVIPTGSTGNRTYTAHWTAVAPETLPTVTKTGYTCGWSTSSSGTTIEYQSGATNYPTSLISEGQAATVNLYAVCTPNTYEITYDYNTTNDAVGNNKYINTDYTIDWSKSFKLNSTINIPTLGNRYLVFGNYNTTGVLNLEINNANKIRLYSNADTLSSGTIANNTDIATAFTYDGGTKAASFTTTGTNSNASVSVTNRRTDTAGAVLRIGTDSRTDNTFKTYTLKAASITDYYTYGTKLTNLPLAPTKSGYTFNGWYTAASGGTAVTTTTDVPAANTTYYAHWTANVYAITLNQENGSGGTATIYEKYNDGYYLNNSNGTVSNKMSTSANGVTVPTRSGYTFVGYYTAANGGKQYIDANGKLTSSASATQFSAAGNLYAHWTKAVSSLTNTLSATNFVYSGSAQGPSVTVKDGTTTLILNTDYTVSGNSSTNVGEYSVTVSGKSAYNSTTKAYYTGTTTIAYYINNATLTFDATTNGGTISGTTPLYAKKGATGVYTTIRGTTGGTIPTATKTGWTFTGWYDGSTKVINADGSIVASVSNWTDSSKNWLITADKTLTAKYTINDPAAPTVTGNGTRVYNYAGRTLTCATTTTYATGTSIYYEFGYATSQANWTAGTITWLGNASTTNTLELAKDAYLGTRYYGCRLYAKEGSTTSNTVKATSAVAQPFINARLYFDATTNGGTIDGVVNLYVPYGQTNIYTGRNNTTAGTIPLATKTGFTFTGWYTAASGGTKIIASDRTVQASVSGWTSATKNWLRTNGANDDTTNVLYAQYTANTYAINYAMNNGPNPSTKPTEGTYNADVVISNPGNKSITVTANANGTGATVGSATTGSQSFSGWTSSTSAGLVSGATTGTAANPTTAWDGSSTTNTYFRNLRNSSGTVTMTANWSGTMSLPTLTAPTGSTCKYYTASTGGSEMGAGGATWTIPSNSATSVTAYARCTANTYTLTINPNGGTYNESTGNSTKDMTYGSTNNNSIGVPTRDGYAFLGWYTAQTGGSLIYNTSGQNVALSGYWSAAYSSGVWQKASAVTIYARWKVLDPAATVSGGTTKIYGASATTLTCGNETTGYLSGSTTYYAFGYSSTANGTPASWTADSTTNTYVISVANSTEFVGTRYYKCRVYVKTGNDQSETSVSAATAVTINNAKITWNANSCGTISGTDPAYVNTSMTGVYTTIDGTTTGTVASTSKAGYTFNGWYTASSGGTRITNGTTILASVANWTDANKKWLITTDKTLYSQCSVITYNIEYTLNNGTCTGSMPITYTVNSSAITLPTTCTKTLSFVPHYSTNASSNATSGSGVSLGTTTTKAQTWTGWTGSNGTTAQKTVTIAAGSTGDKSYASRFTAVAGTLPSVTRDGYTCGWNLSDGQTSRTYSTQGTFPTSAIEEGMSTTVDLYAVCTPDQHTVSFNVNGGSGGTTTSKTATYGEAMPALTGYSAPTKSYYTFGGYYDTSASSGGTRYYKANLTSDHVFDKTTDTTLYARWTPNTYTIYYDYMGGTQGTSCASEGSTCSVGSGVTKYVCYGAKDSYTCKDVTTSITCNTASFGGTDPKPNVTKACYISDNPVSYNYDSAAITIQAPTREGYTFDGWQVNTPSNIHNTYTIPNHSHENYQFVALWTKNKYPFDLNATVNGWNKGNLAPCGTATIKINGTTVATDVTDWNAEYDYGSTWEINSNNQIDCNLQPSTITAGTIEAQTNNVFVVYTFTSKTFSYTGGIQSYKIPIKGTYTLEVWGAQGGTYSSYAGGKGGYAKGNKYFDTDTTIYIGVGQQPTSSEGGYNGGGYGNGYNEDITVPSIHCRGGGGATHIGVCNAKLNNCRNEAGGGGDAKIYIVGGGGGGAAEQFAGGAGGGSSGSAGDGTYAGGGGTQNAGGAPGYANSATAGDKGLGGHPSKLVDTGYYMYHAGGGGGGWYGGGGGDWSRQSGYAGSGGGGSGYVSNLSSTTNTANNKTGNGQAKLTYVSTP